jgi:hypothetical protein
LASTAICRIWTFLPLSLTRASEANQPQGREVHVQGPFAGELWCDRACDHVAADDKVVHGHSRTLAIAWNATPRSWPIDATRPEQAGVNYQHFRLGGRVPTQFCQCRWHCEMDRCSGERRHNQSIRPDGRQLVLLMAFDCTEIPRRPIWTWLIT